MKEYKIVIHGDDNFDEPYIDVLEIEADVKRSHKGSL